MIESNFETKIWAAHISESVMLGNRLGPICNDFSIAVLGQYGYSVADGRRIGREIF
jgi:hypothetical protein